MDTTYRWRMYGYMVFRSRDMKENLLWYRVSYETVDAYKQWIRELQAGWIEITGIVCDWRRWLLWGFWDIPTQMCLFHQKQIIVRNITNKPKLEANKELLEITKMLWRIRSPNRKEWLKDRYNRYEHRLKERNEHWWLIHIRTIKSYKSLIRNMQYLFIYEQYPHIPKTSNGLEWEFSRLKQKLRNHRWLTLERRQKYIERYLNH